MPDTQEPSKSSNNALTRRQFIHGAGAAAATVAGVSTTIGNALGANERIGVGFIGCGGRSNAHLKTVDRLL
ncbi:MAG: twin-arginine translocation signal domain-containing protein [Planctomycetota bacterium]